MPGTRTAPTINGTPTFVSLSVSVIDYSGDLRTDTYQVDADASNAEIEAFIVALQVLSNSSIYRVTVGQTYNSTAAKANALEEVWENAKDNVVLLFKTNSNASIDFYIPAPVNDLFTEGTENVISDDADLATLLGTITPFKANYTARSARLTHRKQIGSKVAL